MFGRTFQRRPNMMPARSLVRAEPNVTPMIDVMLVLLIIFMVVGPALVDGFAAIPPDARFSNRHPDDAGEIVIGVDASGQLYLDKVRTDSATLRRELVTRFSQRPDDRVVFLRADRSLPYGVLQGTIAIASSAGAQVVGLVASEPAK
jgi:biopolymer transport protein TolR